MVEFAFIAPVMCLILMAAGDLLHRGYVQGLLDGEMQKAGRDSAIEGGALKTAEIDNKLRRMIKMIASEATVETKRETYSRFQNIKPERFDDNNNDGVRNAGECFDDVNANKQWDTKPSRNGQGGASDVTVMRATISWPRLFPMAAMLGWTRTQTITSETVLKNQPFAAQTIAAPEPVCT